MKSDIPIKRIIQVRPLDWVRFLLPNIKSIEVTELNAEIIPKSKSQMDKLLLVNNSLILHMEPNGYLDKAIPARMLRYRADIWEYTVSKGMGTPSIMQILILFDEKHDNKQHELFDNIDDDIVLNYKYRVIKVWEMSADMVIKEGLLGLYPLLPLMKQKENTTSDEIIKNAVEIINTVSDEALRSDLTVALSALSEEKYSKDLVRKYIRRETLMKSELLREFAMEEWEKGRAEGKLEGELKGKIEGELKGKLEERLKVAKNLIMLGLEDNKIQLATGLVPEEINELRKIV